MKVDDEKEIGGGVDYTDKGAKDCFFFSFHLMLVLLGVCVCVGGGGCVGGWVGCLCFLQHEGGLSLG